MAYSGLETLFQNLGPTTAASFAGQREGMAQGLDQISAATQQQALLKAQQDYEQANVMNPLAAQFKQGEIARQGAELPGLQGLSQTQVAKGKVDSATADSNIQEKLAKNSLDMTSHDLTKIKNQAESHGILGQQLLGMDPASQEDWKRRYLDKQGIKADSPEGKYLLMTDPQQIVDSSNKIADMSAKLRADRAKTEMEESAKIVMGESRNASNERIAGIRASAVGSGRATGKTFVQSLLAASPDKRLGSVKSILESGVSPDTQQELTEIERTYFQSMYDQDKRTIEAGLAAKTGQGLIVEAKPGGKAGIANKVAPTVGDGGPPRGTAENPIVLK